MLALVLVAGIAPARAQAGWTTLESGSGGVFLACVTHEVGGYGPVWRVRLILATAPGGPQAAARFIVRRPGSGGGFANISEVYMAANGGGWDIREVYASTLGAFWNGSWHPDEYYYAAGFHPGTGGSGRGIFPALARC